MAKLPVVPHQPTFEFITVRPGEIGSPFRPESVHGHQDERNLFESWLAIGRG